MGFRIVHKATAAQPGRLADQIAGGGAVLVAVPTFLLVVGGVEKVRLVGYQSVADLTRAIDEALRPSAENA